MAIYHYHKTNDAEAALRYLPSLAAKYKLSNASRLESEEEKLTGYISWAQSAFPVVIKTKINVRVPLVGELFLAGEVSRLDIDINSGGYRAVLLTDKADDWKSELRMPVLQAAIASTFKRDVGEVAVGVQHLDGSHLETMTFSGSEVQEAEREALRMAEAVSAELARVRG